MSKFKRYTHFEAGFNFIGKRETMEGEDLLGVKTAKEDEFYDGTPLQFDGGIQDVKVCPDGETPDLILYSRVGDVVSDFEWLATGIARDAVLPGDPATAVLAKKNGIIRTKLFTGLSTGDDVEVAGGEYITADTGEVVGKVIDADDDFARIILK